MLYPSRVLIAYFQFRFPFKIIFMDLWPLHRQTVTVLYLLRAIIITMSQ